MTVTGKPKPVVRRLSTDELLPVLSYVWDHWTGKSSLAEPINVPYLAESWSKLMNLGVANSYAIFQNGKALGVLLGMFTPDLHTGALKGIEYLWAGTNTLPMLREFESDCKARGCEEVVFGASARILGTRAPALRRFYRQQGYTPLSEAFSKRL